MSTSATAARAIVLGVICHLLPLGELQRSAAPSAPRPPGQPHGRRGRRSMRPRGPRRPGRGLQARVARRLAVRTRRRATTPPTSTVARWASPRDPNHERSSWSGFEPVTSVPVSLGSSPITTSMAAPKRKPVTTARERNCAIHPILNTARSRNSAPEARVIVATKDATSLGPGDVGRHHGARRHRRQSRARSGRDLAACSEDGVEDRTGGRRVEPVLQRDPRDGGVAEVLGNDERGHGDPGDEITPKPATIVGANPSHHRDEMPAISLAGRLARLRHQCRFPPGSERRADRSLGDG